MLADLDQDGAQIDVAQVQRQRVGQDRGQLAAEQHLLGAAGRGGAFDVANEVTLQRAVVVADIERHQPFDRRCSLSPRAPTTRCN